MPYRREKEGVKGTRTRELKLYRERWKKRLVGKKQDKRVKSRERERDGRERE